MQPTSTGTTPWPHHFGALLVVLGVTLPALGAPRLVNVGDRLRAAAKGADRLEFLEASSDGWPVLAIVETDKSAIAAFLRAVQTKPVDEFGSSVLCDCGRRVRVLRGFELIAECDLMDSGLRMRVADFWQGSYVAFKPASATAVAAWLKKRLEATGAPHWTREFARIGAPSFFAELPWPLIPKEEVSFDDAPFVPPAPNPISSAIPDARRRLLTVVDAIGAFGWWEPVYSPWEAIALDAVNASALDDVASASLEYGGSRRLLGFTRLFFGPRPAAMIPWAERVSPGTLKQFLQDLVQAFPLERESCDLVKRLLALHEFAAAPAGCDDATDALPELQWAVARADAGLEVPSKLLRHDSGRLAARVDLATVHVAEALVRGAWPEAGDLALLDAATAEVLRQRLARSPTTEAIDRAVAGLLVHQSGAIRTGTLGWLTKVSRLSFPDQADSRDSANAIRAWWRAERGRWTLPEGR